MNLIIEIHNVIPDTKERINRSTDLNKIKSFKRVLFIDLLEKTIAHYSVGEDKLIVTDSLLQAISAFEDGYDYETGSDYEFALWMISLGVLCDIALEDYKRVTTILKRENLNDALFSLIIRNKQPDWVESTKAPLWGKPYGLLVNIQSISELKTYLDKHWYQENKDSYWYDLHKNHNGKNYFGYWSWEAAAFAKIKGIDDSSIQFQKYYPYDAAHW